MSYVVVSNPTCYKRDCDPTRTFSPSRPRAPPHATGSAARRWYHDILVQVPSPRRIRPYLPRSFSADISGKHRAKPLPPIPHRFVADVDATLMQRSSTFRSESGNPTYSITARRMISGLLLKPLNDLDLVMFKRYEANLPVSNGIFVTRPFDSPMISNTRVRSQKQVASSGFHLMFIRATGRQSFSRGK